MKKHIDRILILSSMVILSACSDSEKASPNKISTEESTMQSSEEISAIRPEEAPSIKLVNAKDGLSTGFDSVYEEVFWDTTENDITYNFPEIHSGDVEVGDNILIDWSMLNPKPTEVSLIEVKNDSEKVNERSITESTSINIGIDEAEIGKQYAVQFSWKKREELIGKSMLNFKFE
ncbi:hypothetical protein SAMN04488569_101533 [Marinilactibacillus piezotolerans]|uniref:Lipoprotein n=1 Tax=Marinilactibacillus piezotolerans TaxID=258723 RepID=A0A1I3XLJ6_9LACT|nr:hypothetical protein [Marinilactibacillus piezotolerans]SFK20375.1 hypothetical protein SAMN04488569_101533 [Marinilactibacillus piezotolerans]